MKTGKPIWTYETKGAIFSSPVIMGNKVIFGSADWNIYCLDLAKGSVIWIAPTGGPVLGSPLIVKESLFIGSSDHSFRKYDPANGALLWKYGELKGPVVSTAVVYDDKVIFGAWDLNLYALNFYTGDIVWKWNNGSTVRNYSPASCIPVVQDGVVYVVAPDRYISAIDAVSGQTLWRNNDATVRESIGQSEDGKWIYGKTMQDTIVGYHASRQKQDASWKMKVGFGYEHVPSMLIEKNKQLFFGTRSGVVYSVEPLGNKIRWAYKIDNSMVNTVRVVNGSSLVAATMDGKVVLLEYD